jgi:hypothetical protein
VPAVRNNFSRIALGILLIPIVVEIVKARRA